MATVTAKQIAKYREAYSAAKGLTDTPINPLVSTYKEAALRISESMLSLGTDFKRAQAASTLRQISAILAATDADTKKWVERNVPEFYYAGVVRADTKTTALKAKLSQDAIKDLPSVSGLTGAAFNKVHGAQIEAIVTSTYNDFANGLTLTYKNAERTISEAQRVAIRRKMAETTIEGTTLKAKTAAIKKTFTNTGIVAIRDRSGKAWQLDVYAKMLGRTKQMQAHNTAVGMRMVEHGFDLAIISGHGSTCPSCGEWEGRIISLTGATKGYPTLEDVEGNSGHIFGPNCRHVFDPYHPELASRTK